MYSTSLRVPGSHDAKILLEIMCPTFFSEAREGFLSDFEKMVYSLNYMYSPECPEVADFCNSFA